MSSSRSLVGTLSGGNQQKVMLAKWLEADPAVVVLDDPTRGVDVGTKVEIHAIIADVAARGRVVLVASSDHEIAGDGQSEHGLLQAVNTGAVGRGTSDVDLGGRQGSWQANDNARSNGGSSCQSSR